MKKLIVRLLLIAAGILPAVAPTPVFALDFGRSDMDNLATSLNHGNMNVFGRYQFGDQFWQGNQRSVRCTYDFANVGGAIAAITLSSSTVGALLQSKSACIIPKGAIVMEVLIDTITAPTSGGSATIALSTGQGAADLLSATAYSSFSGIQAGIPVGTAATAIKMTADRTPTATIAVATLTAGKFYVIINYNVSQTL